MSRYEIIGLKVPWNEHLQKRGGGRVALIVQTIALGPMKIFCWRVMAWRTSVSLTNGETVTAGLRGRGLGSGSASGFAGGTPRYTANLSQNPLVRQYQMLVTRGLLEA